MTAKTESSTPGTSAQALVPVTKAELRPLKSTLAELDDDDIVAIGQVVGGWSPARVRKLVGVGVGTLAAMALCAISPVGGLGVMVAICGLVVVGGKRDIAHDLSEIGLSPALTETLVKHATLQNTVRSELQNPLALQLAWRDTPRLRDVGTRVVAAARRDESHGENGDSETR